MILLASNYTNSPVFSGLIAAFISGIVAIIGYVITSVVQSKNGKEAIKMQKEIADMQRNQKLFYESQLEWTNETRKLIAKFISDSFRFNLLIEEIANLSTEISKPDFNKIYLGKLSEQADNNLHKANELLSNLNEESTMIRLYLFHEGNSHEKEIINIINKLIASTNIQDGIDTQLLQELVKIARSYFNHQMKELKNMSA